MKDVQKIIFTITKNTEGKMQISTAMQPRYAKTEEEFEKLPIYKREMQAASARIIKLVMKGLAEEEALKRKSVMQEG